MKRLASLDMLSSPGRDPVEYAYHLWADGPEMVRCGDKEWRSGPGDPLDRSARMLCHAHIMDTWCGVDGGATLPCTHTFIKLLPHT